MTAQYVNLYWSIILQYYSSCEWPVKLHVRCCCSVFWETVWPRPLQWLAAQQRWGLQQVSLHLQCYSGSGCWCDDDDDDDDEEWSCITAAVEKPPPAPSQSSAQCWSDWKQSWTLSMLPAVRLSSACTDDVALHAEQHGLTCITSILTLPPRIHWKLKTAERLYE